MVVYFTSGGAIFDEETHNDTHVVLLVSKLKIFAGENKEENELMIKYGFPEDIWFHVDNLPSTHLYIRMPSGSSIDDIPETVLQDCLQLVKDNSIKGRALESVNVIYTPWTNLLKTQDMVVGQVGFHNEKLVYKAEVKKNRDALKVLNKTKFKVVLDFKKLRVQRDQEERKALNAAKRKQLSQNKESAVEGSYFTSLECSNMMSNKSIVKPSFEDFM